MIEFLGIGTQKAGTTWLVKNLQRHPDVWMPRRLKEVHYFDALYCGYDREAHLNRLRRKYGHILCRKSLNDALTAEEGLYYRKIYDPCFAYTDAWYEYIFSPGKEKIKGEFTPSYCAIGRQGVTHVRKIMPDVKLIYIIRDPYERALSSLRMLVERVNSDQRTMDEVIESPLFIKRGDYAGNIPVWDEVFESRQIIYIPFGRLKSDPEGVLRDVEAFLGLEPYAGYPVLSKKVNATGKRKVEIPETIREKLRLAAKPQYHYLKERFGTAFLAETR